MDITELRLNAETLAREINEAEPDLRVEERRGACELLAALSEWDAGLLLAAAGPTLTSEVASEGRQLLIEAARTVQDAP